MNPWNSILYHFLIYCLFSKCYFSSHSQSSPFSRVVIRFMALKRLRFFIFSHAGSKLNVQCAERFSCLARMEMQISSRSSSVMGKRSWGRSQGIAFFRFTPDPCLQSRQKAENVEDENVELLVENNSQLLHWTLIGCYANMNDKTWPVQMLPKMSLPKSPDQNLPKCTKS